jgi:phage shock protein PspC (stress-responsive transcriptional regulator)
MRMELDESNAVVMGVCAGFARWADVDPFLARLAAALVAIFFAPVVIPAYLLAAVLLRPEGRRRMIRERSSGLWTAPFAASQIVW